MKEWDFQSEAKQNRSLVAEGFVVGTLVLGIYGMVAQEVFASVHQWLLILAR